MKWEFDYGEVTEDERGFALILTNGLVAFLFWKWGIWYGREDY